VQISERGRERGGVKMDVGKKREAGKADPGTERSLEKEC
jgi:hypothetical protein